MKGTFRSHAEWKDRGACVESGFSVVFEILVCYKVGPMTGYKLGAHKMLKNSTVIYIHGWDNPSYPTYFSDISDIYRGFNSICNQ